MRKGMIGALGLAVALGLGCVVPVPGGVTAPAAAYAEDVLGVTTLDELTAAVNNGGQVRLDADITGSITVPAGKTVTLDLNGHTLASDTDHTITNNGTLTIKGSGVVDAQKHGHGALVNFGTATLDGGTFLRSKEAGTYAPYGNGGNSWYTIHNRGTMTINDGVEIQNAGGYSSAICNGGRSEDADLTINGGMFSGGINSVKNDEHGTLTIYAGEFSNTSQHVIMNWETATINGGSFKALDSASAVLFNAQYGSAGKLTINDGTFAVTGDSQYILLDYYDDAHAAADTSIKGGTFNGSLIKDNANKGPLSISGGSFSDAAAAVKFATDGNAVFEGKDCFEVRPSGDADLSAYTYKVKTDDGVIYLTSKEAAEQAAKEAGVSADNVEQIRYTVTFETNGHGTVAPVTVEVGSAVTLPAVPEVAGYTGAWYNGNAKVEGSFVPTSDVTLTAMWTKNEAPKPGSSDNNKDADKKPAASKTTKKAKDGKIKGGLPQTGDDSLFAIASVAVAGIVVIVGGIAVAKRRNN